MSGQILLKIYQSQRELSKNKIYSQLLINQSSIDIPERDIFKLSTVAMSLDLWSSKELAFLGLVKQGELTLGIVSDPLGGIYRVAVGDRIGLNQSKITAIDKHGITTVNRTDNLLHGN